VDEIYWGLVLHPYRRMCGWLDRFDAGVVDGTVRLSGLVTEMTSLTLRFVQTGRLRTYAFFLLIGAVLLLGYLLLLG
jgi:NADH:ubiquinone oxidoreductase subunit 5 (subunit L)/multisubunit Na+/H+ antiporter MnhA subunit